MALVLGKLDVPSAKDRPVVHFAPEVAISEILWKRYGKNYIPADLDPEGYSWAKNPVMKIDLSEPRKYLSNNSLSLVVHSHVLEHVYAPIDRILSELNDTIAPGGVHLFQIPIVYGWYKEDMNQDMPREERHALFGQFNHARAFGTKDFEDRVIRHFKDFDQINIRSLVSLQDLAEARVPVRSLTQPTGHTVFAFRKRKRAQIRRSL